MMQEIPEGKWIASFKACIRAKELSVNKTLFFYAVIFCPGDARQVEIGKLFTDSF